MVFVPQIWSTLPLEHCMMVPLVTTLPYLFTYLSHKKSSHKIGAGRTELYTYPYDFKLFHPSMWCVQCQILRPARSRHCRLCNSCISRADHHCIWVDNCIGEGNLKCFLALLLSLITVLTYAVFLTYLQLGIGMISSLSLAQNRSADERLLGVDAAYYQPVLVNQDFWRHTLRSTVPHGQVGIAFVGCMALLTAPVILAFLSYHVYLVSSGMTTYEHCKWRAWRDAIAERLVYTASIPNRSDFTEQGSILQLSRLGPATQFLVLTTDGRAPRKLPQEVAMQVGEHAVWTSVRTLRNVENIYDSGVLGNWKIFMKT